MIARRSSPDLVRSFREEGNREGNEREFSRDVARVGGSHGTPGVIASGWGRDKERETQSVGGIVSHQKIASYDEGE